MYKCRFATLILGRALALQYLPSQDRPFKALWFKRHSCVPGGAHGGAEGDAEGSRARRQAGSKGQHPHPRLYPAPGAAPSLHPCCLSLTIIWVFVIGNFSMSLACLYNYLGPIYAESFGPHCWSEILLKVVLGDCSNYFVHGGCYACAVLYAANPRVLFVARPAWLLLYVLWLACASHGPMASCSPQDICIDKLSKKI